MQQTNFYHFPELSPQAKTILEKRYLLRDIEGNLVETPHEMFNRVATAAASVEMVGEDVFRHEFFCMMANLDFMPNSPVLMNLGTDKGCGSACFVLNLSDTMEDILQVARDAVMIEKYGGGVGFSLTDLRPEGYPIATTHGKACGPIAVLKYLSAGGDLVTQAGKRSGAHMAIISVYHPDIMKFVKCKETEGDIANFNISVGVDAEFMMAVETDGNIHLEWPLCREICYEQHMCLEQNNTSCVSAKLLFDLIVEHAWSNGEPGMVWLDRMNEDNFTPNLGEIKATNPCVSGDTRVFTADGLKTFKELAEKGDDIPILSVDDNGVYSFQIMRNPRLTQANVDTVIVDLVMYGDDGYWYDSLIVTPEHHFMLLDGTKIEAQYLQTNNSLACIYDGQVSVDSVRPGHKRDVYNGTVDNTHRYVIACGEISVVGVVSFNCGEEPLLHREQCCLGSVNVANFVRDDTFDWNRLQKTIASSVRFLDNVIDAQSYATPEIEEMNKKTRKIGLGVMGWADALVKLNIPYDSVIALELADELMSFFKEHTTKTSQSLGLEKGSFLAFSESKYHCDAMRNSWVMSIAPTGTISMIAGCSFGIEPLFALSYKKQNMSAALAGEEFEFINEELRKRFLNASEGNAMVVDQYPPEDMLRHLGKDAAKVFVTANQIEPLWHVLHQGRFQEYVDAGVSKTINLPNSATKENVSEIYKRAHLEGCKGITVYREGSRQKEVIVSLSGETVFSDFETSGTLVVNPPTKQKRPQEMSGITHKVATAHGSLYVTMNSDSSDNLFEVFGVLGKGGRCNSAIVEAIARLISLSLRSGISPKVIVGQLKDISCCPVWNKGTLIQSVPDAIAHAMSLHCGLETNKGGENMLICPDCDNVSLVYNGGGCASCTFCGYSKC